METLTLSAKDCAFRTFQFQFQPNQFQDQVQCQQNLTPENRRTQNPSTEGEAKMAEGSKDLELVKTKLRVSDSKNDKNVNKDKSDQQSSDNNDPNEKPKKKKKWKKLQPSEIGFNISLFPRPVRDNCETNWDADALWTKIEKECETVEKIIEPYQKLIELEGTTSRDKRYIRVDRDRKVIKAHKQVKTKYCRSVLNNKGRKAIYVNHRVYKMMDLDIQRLCYMPSPKKAKNVLKRDIARGKDNYSINQSTNKPHQPNRTYRPTPVQCLAHAIHKDNLPSDIDAALANLLMNLQHRDLTPEDYDMLLRLDEARVKPKTMSEDKLSAFKTETVESNDELEVCPICMDLYEKGQIKKFLPCQHAFHIDCIDSWLKNSSMNCPIDNLPIES